MPKPKLLLVALAGWAIVSLPAPAQDTNVYLALPPPTILENLEASIGQLIVKGTEPVGSVVVGAAIITIDCKEDTLVGANRKEYGIAVEIAVNGQPADRTILDYDELASLLNSLDYLANINSSVTSLSGFNAFYASKAGLRVSAFRSRRIGQIELAVRTNRMPNGMLLTNDQWAQFRSLVDQAKRKIDALRKG